MPILPHAAAGAALAVFLALPLPAAAELSCDAKRASIERDMAAAREQGQTRRLAGLKRALAGVDKNCTDAGLRDAHRRDVEKKREEVAERERDLQEAVADGDVEDITRRQRKLQEEREELEALLQQAGPAPGR